MPSVLGRPALQEIILPTNRAIIAVFGYLSNLVHKLASRDENCRISSWARLFGVGGYTFGLSQRSSICRMIRNGLAGTTCLQKAYYEWIRHDMRTKKE
jgi:hypothetical protein